MTLKVLLWDVDGTLAETERDGHRVAFNHAFEACGLPWRWSIERYGELLAISGGRERLMHDMSARTDAPASLAQCDALARLVHHSKNSIYAEIVAAGTITLRPGVRELIAEAGERGVRMAVVTTTSRSNVATLLRTQLGACWADSFDFCICGEDVAAKKPHPQAYLQALRCLRLQPREALAIEDSPAGAAAAHAAGVPVIVTRSVYFAASTIDDAVAIGPGLAWREDWQPEPSERVGAARIELEDLCAWHRGVEPVQTQPRATFKPSQ